MNAHDVIACYVNDVAARLPRRQRRDVALELQALLTEQLAEQLAEHAEADHRAADAALATALVRGMGAPAAVAARYRPSLVVIEPSDGPAFVKASVFGVALLWLLGALQVLQAPTLADADALQRVAYWWTHVAIASLWWPGALAVGFALAAWTQRRGAGAVTWTPRPHDRIVGGRAAMVLGMVGIVCGVSVLLSPTVLLDVVWGGRAAPSAYAALTYTDNFLARQALPLLLLLLSNLPLYLAVLARGRWTPTLQRVETALALLTCAVMAWTVADGPVLRSGVSDQTAKTIVVLLIALTLGSLLHKRYARALTR